MVYYCTPIFLPFQEPQIATQLPRDVAVIRFGLTALAVTVLILKTQLTWSWPVVVLGSGFAIHVAIQHLLKKDPLAEAFYQIAGGKKFYDALPFMFLKGDNKNIFDEIIRLRKSNLYQPFYRSAISGERNVLIVRDDFTETGDSAIGVYVEKISTDDVDTLTTQYLTRKILQVFSFACSLRRDHEVAPTVTFIGEESSSAAPRHRCFVSGKISYSHANRLQKQYKEENPLPFISSKR